ncbi:MAG: ABC transporter permease, partial [Deltaproteobacteria bacterium]
IYKDKKNFFAQFGISGSDYLNLYPEFIVSQSARQAFDRNRNAAIAGRKLARRFGWKIGDVITLQGTIFPVNMELVLKGIYRGARKNVDETAFFFRYDYLNELLKGAQSSVADRVGWFVVRIRDPRNAAAISQAIDAVFQNSLAETLTETEKAFQLGFVAMTDAIVVSIQVISFVVHDRAGTVLRIRGAQDPRIQRRVPVPPDFGGIGDHRNGRRYHRNNRKLSRQPIFSLAIGDIPPHLRGGAFHTLHRPDRFVPRGSAGRSTAGPAGHSHSYCRGIEPRRMIPTGRASPSHE